MDWNDPNIKDWIEACKKLPEKEGRFLAVCRSEEREWLGVVDVYFNPNRGWLESETKNPIYVLKYTKHPFTDEKNCTRESWRFDAPTPPDPDFLVLLQERREKERNI